MHAAPTSFTAQRVRLSDFQGDAVRLMVAIDDSRNMAATLRRIGNVSVRNKWADFICEVKGGREGVREYGYYRCGLTGDTLRASRIAPPYSEVYSPQHTLEEYESGLHFNGLVRLWRFSDTPAPKHGQ